MDRIKFLRWPKSIKNALYQDPDLTGYWYICEIEEKMIVPALTNYPEDFEERMLDDRQVDRFAKEPAAFWHRNRQYPPSQFLKIKNHCGTSGAPITRPA